MSLISDDQREKEEVLLQIRWNIDRLRGDAYAAVVIFFSATSLLPVAVQKTNMTTLEFIIIHVVIAAIAICSWIWWFKVQQSAQREHTRHFNLSGRPDPYSIAPIFEFVFQDRVLYASLASMAFVDLITWLVRLL